MGLFDSLGEKIAADFKRAILGGGNQNAGLTPINRKSLQKENRVADFGDKPNFLSGGRVVPSFSIDTNKSYIENLYDLNNNGNGTGKGGLNGVPVPPTSGFGPEKYSPENNKAYDMGASGVVYNKATGVRELPDGLNGRIQEMQQRLDGSVGSDNSVKDEQQAREKINNVHKPFVPEGTPVFTDNPSVYGAGDYNEYTSSNIAKTVDQRREEPYTKTIITTDPMGERPAQSKLHGEVSGQAANVDLSTQPSAISPIHNQKERGSAKTQQTDFENRYTDANRKLKAEHGILNDVKHKSVIDQIAKTSGKGTNTQGYESKYGENARKTFTNNPQMKMPRYNGMIDGTANDRIDKFNALSVLKVPEGKGDKNAAVSAMEHSDFVALYFHDLVNKKYIPFRAFINSMSDQFDATWNAVNYLGRADAVQVYGGCGRTFSIGFTAHAFGIEELHPMWQRINHLCGLTKPASYTNKSEANSGSSFIIPPMVKFNLGDIYKNQPAIITSVSVELPNEGKWELYNNEKTSSNGGKNAGGGKDEFSYLNDTIKRSNVKSARYPSEVSLSVSMTFLEKRLPKTQNRHFGDAKGEREHGFDSSGDDGAPYDKTASFNTNLNRYPDVPEEFK